MGRHALIDEIRATARQILENKTVDLVIGYEAGTRGATRPAFIYSADEADRLVWNDACTHNLANYVRDKHVPPKRGAPPAKLGLVLKACDARAINVLLRENQVPRGDLYLIGVACEGMRQNAGFAARAPGDLQPRCQACTERVPVVYDVLVGEVKTSEVSETSEVLQQLNRLEAMTPAERQAFWDAEFARCLRCYACRQACPGCYCVECTAEQLDPEWVGIGIRPPEKRFFHTMRAYHLAGRCVGCDECARVCPVGVRLDLLNAWFRHEVEQTFGYKAGADATTPAPLATFRPDENLEL
jgi:ferredoxin